jgi:hypothetical protein
MLSKGRFMHWKSYRQKKKRACSKRGAKTIGSAGGKNHLGNARRVKDRQSPTADNGNAGLCITCYDGSGFVMMVFVVA